jgi:hypothetical protein
MARRQLPSEVIPIGYDGFGGSLTLVVAGPRRGQIWFQDVVDSRPEGSNPLTPSSGRAGRVSASGSGGMRERGRGAASAGKIRVGWG